MGTLPHGQSRAVRNRLTQYGMRYPSVPPFHIYIILPSHCCLSARCFDYPKREHWRARVQCIRTETCTMDLLPSVVPQTLPMAETTWWHLDVNATKHRAALQVTTKVISYANLHVHCLLYDHATRLYISDFETAYSWNIAYHRLVTFPRPSETFRCFYWSDFNFVRLFFVLG